MTQPNDRNLKIELRGEAQMRVFNRMNVFARNQQKDKIGLQDFLSATFAYIFSTACYNQKREFLALLVARHFQHSGTDSDLTLLNTLEFQSEDEMESDDGDFDDD